MQVWESIKSFLGREHGVLLLLDLGTVVFLLFIDMLPVLLISPSLVAMIYYHFVLLPLIGWNLLCLPEVMKSFFFKKEALVKTTQVTTTFHSTNASTIAFKDDFPTLTILVRYAQWWAAGFMFLFGLGFILGFFLQALTRSSLIMSLQLFFILMLVILLMLAFKTINSKSSEDQGNERGSHDDQSRSLAPAMGRTASLLLLIFAVVFIPRIPNFLDVGGVLGVDTWYTSALASRIVYHGKIDFISGMLGLLEVYPTDKAVAAPLSLALLSIFSRSSVLDVQFFHVVWMTTMGLLILAGFFNQFLSALIKDLTITRQWKKTPVWNLGVIALSSSFYLIPTVLTYTDGFLSGRTLFFVFFPLFFHVSWELVEKYNAEGLLKKEKVGTLLVILVFLTISHRMALTVLAPTLLVIMLWIHWNERKTSTMPEKKQVFGTEIEYERKMITFGRMVDLMPILIFFIANMMLYIQIIKGDLVMLWFNEFYTHQYFPSWLIGIISANRLLDGIVGGFLGLSLATGGILPIFLLTLMVWQLIPKKGRLNHHQALTITYIRLLILGSLPALLLLYQGSYFFQVSLPFMFVITLTISILSFECTTRRLVILPKLPSFAFIKKKTSKVSSVLILMLVVSLVGVGVLVEHLRVNRSLNMSEGEKRHLSEELRYLAMKISSLLEKDDNVTILTSSGTVALKLSVLIPHVRFLPNHQSLYVAYGFVSYNGYRLRQLPNYFSVAKFFGWAKYPFDTTPLHEFEKTLQDLLNSSVSSPESRDLLKSWNVKYVLILKPSEKKSSSKSPLIFSSVEAAIDPIIETTSYRVYDIASLLGGTSSFKRVSG